MGFSFGGTTTTPAAAPATGGGRGGFSFGAPAAPVVTSTAATTDPSTNTGSGSTSFSFGAAPPAPATTTAATATSSGGGVTFGGTTATTTPASTSTPAATSAAPASFSFTSSLSTTNNNATAASNSTATATSTSIVPTNANSNSTAANVATASIPTYQDSFPFLAMYDHIETLLHSIHAYSSDDTNDVQNIDTTDLRLQGQELYHLLGTLETAESATTYGQSLSNPLNVLKFNSTTSPYTPNVTLRQNLQSKPWLQLPLPSNPQQQQSPMNVPSSMLEQIFRLSDLLQIPEMDAASIYGVILSSLYSNRDSNTLPSFATSSTTTSPLQEHLLGQGTKTWFQNRHTRPDFISGFIDGCKQRAKENKTYISNDNNNDKNVKQKDEKDEKENYILKLAMDLYFTERQHYLKTLLLLIQHRVSVYSTSLSELSSSSSSNHESTPQELAASIIIESTDQLIIANLIPNLVGFIREMSILNDSVRKKICIALDQKDRMEGRQEQHQQQHQHQQQQSGLFGFQQPNNVTNPPNNTTSSSPYNIHDVDYAMYEFTLRQRQLAADCLFYLAYHTQCTQAEIVSIVDVVQEMTNGSGGGRGTSTGSINTVAGDIGSGLSILDPIRDVPDPYKLSWNAGDSSSSSSQDVNQYDIHGSMQGVTMTSNTTTTPHQCRIEKGREEWDKELISSLFSPRGLTNATITSAHSDYTGQRQYSAVQLQSMNTDVTVMSGPNSRSTKTAIVVEGGKPQLLQCVTTLILSIVSSLDARNILLDRDIHRPNNFGSGNALFPPQLASQHPTEIHEGIADIHQRLNPNSPSFDNWKRKDIGGLLTAAYALLLRPPTSKYTSPQKSPRERSSSYGSSNAIYHTFRKCLECPTLYKSLTFARVSLLPSIGSPSMKSSSILDNDFSFAIAIVADFTSQYLDALSSISDLPISRAKWMEREQQELQLKHVQESQRRQLNAWSGQNYQGTELPSEVDIFQRPDCLDDIIALGVNVCYIYPECAGRFWSQDETIIEHDSKASGDNNQTIHLKPGRILRKLESLQVRDTSLLPVYLSFLGAISLYQSPYDEQVNGAMVVHEWMYSPRQVSSSSPNSFGEENRINWEYILNAIRWYAQQLNPPPEMNDSWRTSDAKYDEVGSDEPTGYYYGTDSSANYNSNQKARQSIATKSSSSQNVKKSLDENDSKILLSLLKLLSYAVMKSEVARRYILGIRLPVSGSKRFIGCEDDALTILFSLAVLNSISPEIRGMTLSGISNLVRCASSSEKTEKDDETTRRCWDLLELSQLLPTRKLSQYSSSESPTLKNAFLGSFPKKEQHWFPPSEDNGIIYEMEYVESKNGTYPATEGFLKLLAVLFSSGVLPSNLGSDSRMMLGCSPYVEYVIDFFLPRIMNTRRGFIDIYFLAPVEKTRLLSRALDVVNAVLIRYTIPETSVSGHSGEPNLIAENSITNDACRSTLAHDEMKKSIPQSLSLVSDDIAVCVDSVPRDQDDFANNTMPADGSNKEPIPKAKSPGYYILADLLSADGLLLNILSSILMSYHDTNDDDESCRNTVQVKAIFGDFVPKYSNTKNARDYLIENQRLPLADIQMSSIAPQFVDSLMVPLYTSSVEELPQVGSYSSSSSTGNDEIMWKEYCQMLILRIICAAAGMDDKFKKRLNESKENTSHLVPVLRLLPRDTSANMPLYMKNMQSNGISRLITQDQSIILMMIKLVGYQSASLLNNNSISTAAMSILFFLSEDLPPNEFSRCLKSLRRSQQANIAISFSSRLSLSNQKCENYAIIHSILKFLVSDGNFSNENSLSHYILGLSSKTSAEKKTYLVQCSRGFDVEFCDHKNALDSLIHLVSDIKLAIIPQFSSLASKCYEILFRLCDNRAESYKMTKYCVMSKLRKLGFWQNQLIRFVGKPDNEDNLLTRVLTDSSGDESVKNERNSNFMHCVSWVMKGITLELRAMTGCNISGDDFINSALSSQPHQLQQLLHLLIGGSSSLIANTLVSLPMKKPIIARFLYENSPRQDILNSSSQKMVGSQDICSGYHLIDQQKLVGLLNKEVLDKDIIDGQIDWAMKWNNYATLTCASEHLCCSWYFLAHASITCLPDGIGIEKHLIETLKMVLIQLDSSGQHFDVHNSTISCIASPQSSNDFEAKCALPLCVLCPILVEKILSITSSDTGSKHEILILLVRAISSCSIHGGIEDILSMERAADLSCALVALLASGQVQDNSYIADASTQQIFPEVYSAAKSLASLATFSSNDMIQGDNGTCYISSAARAGIISMLRWICQKDSDLLVSNVEFLDRVFASQSYNIPHQHRVHLVTKYIEILENADDSIVDLLEVITLCPGGTEILVNHGLSKVLVSISTKYFENNKTFSNMSYGGVGAEYPNFIKAHVSLLHSMLSSDVPRTVDLQLRSDAIHFLQLHSQSLEQAFSYYPNNHDLVMKVVNILCLLVVDDKDGVNMDMSFCASVWFKNLERNIINLALHIAINPLPNKFLRNLPKRVIDCFVQAQQMGFIISEKTWWNTVESNMSQGSINLPDPLLPPAFAEQGSGNWTVSKYDTACAAFHLVDVCLLYLHRKSMNKDDTVDIDIARLLASICRSNDVIKVVVNRLIELNVDSDKNFTSRISSMMGSNHEYSESTQRNTLEIDALKAFRVILVGCFEKFLHLAYHKTRYTKTGVDAVSTSQSFQSVFNHISLELGDEHATYFCNHLKKQIIERLKLLDSRSGQKIDSQRLGYF